MHLQKSEQCYFTINADWLELRTVTQKYNYRGPAFRITAMKGISYRFGSVSVQRITEDKLQLIDSGRIYLTNKRIIFIGARKNSNIKLETILSIVPFSDGVEIEKDTGKSPVLRVRNDADILAMILSRLINDAH